LRDRVDARPEHATEGELEPQVFSDQIDCGERKPEASTLEEAEQEQAADLELL
jgi:hypothetical protein